MPLGNVCNLVGDNARQFVFIAGGVDKTRMNANVAAGQGKGVDTRVLDNEERKFVVALVGLGCDPVTDVVRVVLEAVAA